MNVVQNQPMEYSAPRPASRLLGIGTGVLGVAVIVQLLIGVAVLS
ncbi:hypothetical protein [Microbacterium sp. Root280D1]|nr:hypothetical protein [Microbacterium sp. Root280D1]